jgi:hypothetical protein
MLFDRVVEKMSEDEDTRISTQTAKLSNRLTMCSLFSTPN